MKCVRCQVLCPNGTEAYLYIGNPPERSLCDRISLRKDDILQPSMLEFYTVDNEWGSSWSPARDANQNMNMNKVQDRSWISGDGGVMPDLIALLTNRYGRGFQSSQVCFANISPVRNTWSSQSRFEEDPRVRFRDSSKGRSLTHVSHQRLT